MKQELTPSQEDLINEPRKVCEICKKHYPKDEITIAKIDNGESIELCSGCYEALQESCYENYDEEYCDE